MKTFIFTLSTILFFVTAASGESPHIVNLDDIISGKSIAVASIDSSRVKPRGLSGTNFVNPLRYTGDLFVTGDGTFTGAFTSPGIDDNADDIAITIDVTTEKVTMSADADVVAALTAGTIASDATVVAATTISTGANGGTSGQVNYIASDNDQGNSAITTDDELAHTGFSGGLTNDSNIQGTTLESASATPTVTFDDTSEQDWTITTGDGDMHVSGASEYVTIVDPTGWVGIGDTTPDSPLDVVGGVRADSLLIGDNWRIVATSTVMKWENY